MVDLNKYKNIIHLSDIDADGYGCQLMTSTQVENECNIHLLNTTYGVELIHKINKAKELATKISEDGETCLIISDL